MTVWFVWEYFHFVVANATYSRDALGGVNGAFGRTCRNGVGSRGDYALETDAGCVIEKMARNINLSGMISGFVLVFVLILVFAAFSGPISDAINDTYVGSGAASTLWTSIVFLLIVLSVILAVVFWALSHVSGKGRGG